MEKQTPETYFEGTLQVRPAWEFEPQWLHAWERTAELTDAVLQQEDPELALIRADDPLGSAKAHAKNPSPENRQYLVDDIRTGVFEGLVKRGHVSKTQSQYNESDGSFWVGSTSIRRISARGLANPDLNNTEFNRRSIEAMFEFFTEDMYRSGELNQDTALVWITPYAHEMAISEAEELGYFSEQKTYFIRWVEADTRGKRVTKQLSMKGSNPARLSQTLSRLGIEEAEAGLSASGVLMAPIAVRKTDFPSSIVDVARLVDNGEHFLGGEPMSCSYDELETISQQREDNLSRLFDDFADHVSTLAAAELAGKLTRHESKTFYKESLRTLIDSAAGHDPEMAREAIGERSADLYKLAAIAAANGLAQEADSLRMQAAAASDNIYLCGMSLNSARQNQTTEGLLACIEFKLGQHVTCPACRRRQIIKQGNLTSERLYCDNKVCSLAKVRKGTRRQPPKPAPKPLFKKQSHDKAKRFSLFSLR